MTHSKHVRQAMVEVLRDETGLPIVDCQKIVERQLVGIVNAREVIRGTALKELPTYEVEVALRVLAALND